MNPTTKIARPAKVTFTERTTLQKGPTLNKTLIKPTIGDEDDQIYNKLGHANYRNNKEVKYDREEEKGHTEYSNDHRAR